MSAIDTAKSRPAEIGTGVAGAVAALIAYFGHITDPAVVAALVVVVAFVPTAITWIVHTIRGH